MTSSSSMTRREVLRWVSAGALSARFVTTHAEGGELNVRGPSKSVAAVITAYREILHADVLVGKILEGWNQDGGPGPNLTLASMYLDQSKPDDLGVKLAEKYQVPIFDTIEGALTVGTSKVAVDGVLSVGEHGNYPWNDKAQHLYPRRRFFEGITSTFEKHGQVVPVFNDKHLGPEWPDAKWMYEKALQLKIPFMAGSSVVVTYREPDFAMPMNSEIEEAVAVGYSGLDIYGIHTLEWLQAFVERRKGGETGVAWVQCLLGDKIWRAVDEGIVSKEMLDAAIAVVPKSSIEEMRSVRNEHTALFLFQYNDGLRCAVFMLQGYAEGISVAVKTKGQSQPVAVNADLRTQPKYPQFAFLLHGIERMIHTGKPSYPVERTLLCTGILDRALTSRYEGQRKIVTPELAIRYSPVDYPHAPRPALPL